MDLEVGVGGSRPRSQGAYPAYPERLLLAVAQIRSERRLSWRETEEFHTALCLYAQDLRGAGVSRDQLVRAIWPLFVGVANAGLVQDALEWCVAAYDHGEGSQTMNKRARRS
jgi:hypothetical protein